MIRDNTFISTQSIVDKYLQTDTARNRKGVLRLLEIKDRQIRLLNLQQCQTAVDGAIHIGGASSATIPMVSLYYGGFLNLNIEDPTEIGQDMFILSKGHAVATLASIYVDLGYFESEILNHSRSIKSILNGHPGPLLPGVHVATGPMGQGMGVAQGLAIAGQNNPTFDVFALTGDGELQEGPIWEAMMYAGFKKLENFCVLIDHNGGQLDDVSKLHFPFFDLAGSLGSFGWEVYNVDATQYHAVYDALAEFKFGKRKGKPTAIICNSSKGHGGGSSFMTKHKAVIPEELLKREVAFQKRQEKLAIDKFCMEYNLLKESGQDELARVIEEKAESIGFKLVGDEFQIINVREIEPNVITRKAPVREKAIRYDREELPKLKPGNEYAGHKVIEAAMEVFAQDSRVFSVDSDLASTSGLQAGVGLIDRSRALNVGVAEANMVLIGEGLALLGYNTWVSTFCPFFDWKLIRRIAVGHQERLEVIAKNGWLSEGHGLDLTLLATAADFDTQCNGATHMGNDDVMMMNEAAYIKVINVSCPQQLLSIMEWIMAGNKGIIYLRILRAPSAVLYPHDFSFEYEKGYQLLKPAHTDAYIIASGRTVHEALEAAEILKKKNINIDVVDMPSIDSKLLLNLVHSDLPILVAEQNNGYIWNNLRKVLFQQTSVINTKQLHALNTTTENGLHYIHSGTYPELADHYRLNAKHLVDKTCEIIKNQGV